MTKVIGIWQPHLALLFAFSGHAGGYPISKIGD